MCFYLAETVQCYREKEARFVMHVQTGATINELISEDASGQHQAAAPSHTKVRFMLSKSVFCFYRRDT